MKRIIALFICLVMAVTFSACTKDVASSETLQIQNETSSVDSSNEQSSEEATSVESTSSEETKSEASSSKPTASSKPTSSNKGNSSISNPTKGDTTSLEATSSTIFDNVTGDIVGADGNEPVYGVDYGGFVYTGRFVSYATKGDIFYMAFSSPNILVAYDSAGLEVVYEKVLPGVPAEIQVDETSLSVSYPKLEKIIVYDRNTFTQTKEYKLGNPVASFCIDGDIVYYSELDQFCKVYRTNIVSNETVVIKPQNSNYMDYYQPKLYLNKESGKLYIGESAVSTCRLYCYDTTDLSLVQSYVFSSYNYTRTMFMIDDELYWAGIRFDPDDLSVIGQYGGTGYAYMYYVDENFVFLNGDVYERESYRLVARIEQIFRFIGTTENMSLVIVNQSGSEFSVVVVPY